MVQATSAAAQIDRDLGHLVGGIDSLGVRLEVALRSDQRDQLLGDVDIGLLQRARLDEAEAALTLLRR
jgi:hypothetical protein